MQSLVPSRRSVSSLLRDTLIAQKLNVAAPRLVTGLANVVTEVFTAKQGVAFRMIQNCGTTAVKVAVNTDVDATSFHFVLAACSAQDDGLGSVQDLSRFEGRVTITSTGAYRVCTFEAMAPEALV